MIFKFIIFFSNIFFSFMSRRMDIKLSSILKFLLAKPARNLRVALVYANAIILLIYTITAKFKLDIIR